MSEVENHTLAMLREMRDENRTFQQRLLSEFDEVKKRLESLEQDHGKKLDKLGVDLYGVRGRVKNLEDAVAMIARVVSDRAL
jgi:DNA-directed RNA polymerase subunit N (RpoN/RPB10)